MSLLITQKNNDERNHHVSISLNQHAFISDSSICFDICSPSLLYNLFVKISNF